MDARHYVTLKKFLKAGDKAVVYTHGGRFVAIIEFVGKYFYSKKDMSCTKGKERHLFPYRIKFRIINESKNPPKISSSTIKIGNKAQHEHPNLIDCITFTADKGRTWNQYLRISIIRITKEDFNTISKAIRRADSRHAHSPSLSYTTR
jgi:hypothetical protein